MLIENIGKESKSFFKNTNCNLTVLSAFVKSSMMRELDSLIPVGVAKRLILRGRKNDFLSGVSDMEAVEFALNNGWEVYLNLSLHAKIYISDQEQALIGSANLTESGFGNANNSNIELSTVIQLQNSDLMKIENIIESSFRLNQRHLQLMTSSLRRTDNLSSSKFEDNWDFVRDEKVEYLFPSDLLEVYSTPLSQTNRSILGLYDLPVSDREIANAFLDSNEYQWLENKLLNKENKQLTFGELSGLLHNSVLSLEKIRRKDIKQAVANLLSWIKEFNKESGLSIECLNHSTVIHLTTKQ